MNNFSITTPCEGEVLFLEENKPESKKEAKQETYKVRVFLPNGSETVVHNVTVATIFGDPLNTSRQRLRPAFLKNETNEVISNQEGLGDRVIVTFLGGNIRRPVVTGLLPHVKSENKLGTKDKTEPCLFFSYQGIDVHIDKDGQLKLTHNGAPERNIRDLKENDDKDNITTVKILKDGTFDITDSKKQKVKIDTTKESIYLGTAKSDIVIDLKNEKCDITSNREVNIKTNTCTVDTKKLTEVNSPHIILKTNTSKAEFKGGQWEISSPTFKLLEDIEKLLTTILNNAPQTTFHPAIGFTMLNIPQNTELLKQIGKIKTTRLK